MGRIRRTAQSPRASTKRPSKPQDTQGYGGDGGDDADESEFDSGTTDPGLGAAPAPRRPATIDAEKIIVETDARSRTTSASAKKAARRRRKRETSQLQRLATGVLKYAFDILYMILSLLKWPIALLLTIAMGRFLLYQSLARITGALSSQVRLGVCSIPFAASLVQTSLPGFCSPAEKVDFADLLAMQQGAASTASLPVYSGSLPLQLKKAELATSDLRTVLQNSDLSCKQPLDTALQAFSLHARDSSRAIQRTVVRVRGMVDAQLAMNEWAVSALSRIEGVTTGGVLNALVPAFLASYDTRSSVTKTYIHAMDELSDTMRRLIEANEQAYESLDALEEDLHLIHEITGMEKHLQMDEQDKVLSNLWSLLGGNKKAKKFYKENLKVLGDFERSRIADKEVVAATSVAFTKMMLQIEYMREQIQRPGLSRDDIPIEMHIRSIELGIENLRNSKTAAQDTLESDFGRLLD